MAEKCIFCKIYELKQDILYEDETSFLLADINPLSDGHLLLIPKEHTEFLHQLSDKSLGNILSSIKKIVKTLNYQKYNILQNNGHIQSVKHVHFHIIPVTNGVGLKINWEIHQVDDQYLERVRKNVKKALN